MGPAATRTCVRNDARAGTEPASTGQHTKAQRTSRLGSRCCVTACIPRSAGRTRALDRDALGRRSRRCLPGNRKGLWSRGRRKTAHRRGIPRRVYLHRGRILKRHVSVLPPGRRATRSTTGVSRRGGDPGRTTAHRRQQAVIPDCRVPILPPEEEGRGTRRRLFHRVHWLCGRRAPRALIRRSLGRRGRG